MASPFLVFPTELRGGGTQNYPYIRFICEETSGQSQSLSSFDMANGPGARNRGANTQEVILPVPPGVSVNDGASYNDINLGAMSAQLKFSEAKGVGAGISAWASEKWNRLSGQNIASLATKLASDARGEAIQLGNRQIFNPNKVLTFGGTQIRSNNFSFKMVARDKTDALAIRDIIRFFRKYMYPDDIEGKGLLMKYPSLWTIKFMDGPKENPYMPKIFPSYLTAMQATYNSSTNILYDDGSPVECDVQISFQEAKALTRFDLEKMADIEPSQRA